MTTGWSQHTRQSIKWQIQPYVSSPSLTPSSPHPLHPHPLPPSSVPLLSPHERLRRGQTSPAEALICCNQSPAWIPASHESVRSIISSFIHSLVYLFMQQFICSFSNSFSHPELIVQLFVCSFVGKLSVSKCGLLPCAKLITVSHVERTVVSDLCDLDLHLFIEQTLLSDFQERALQKCVGYRS